MEPRGLVISLRQSAFFPSGERRAGIRQPCPPCRNWPSSDRHAPQLDPAGRPHRFPCPFITSASRATGSCPARGASPFWNTLCDTFHLSRDRFSVVGRADTVPIDTNDTPEGRARNRRVDVVIVNSLEIQPEEAAKARGQTLIRAVPCRLPKCRRFSTAYEPTGNPKKNCEKAAGLIDKSTARWTMA